MVMNNIIFLVMCNYSKGRCSFTAMMSHLQMRTKTDTKTFK